MVPLLEQERPLSDGEKNALAEKFKPILLLFPEFEPGEASAAKAGQTDPELTHDYHPRDIRLVLSMANRRPGVDGTGPAGLLQAFGRQWPIPILAFMLVFASGWIAIFSLALGTDSWGRFAWWWVPYGLTTAPLFFAAFNASFQAPWWQRVLSAVFSVTAIVLGLVLLLPNIPAAVLIGFSTGFFIPFPFFLPYLLYRYRSRQDPDRLLAWLTDLADPDRFRRRLGGALQEATAGPVASRDSKEPAGGLRAVGARCRLAPRTSPSTIRRHWRTDGPKWPPACLRQGTGGRERRP